MEAMKTAEELFEAEKMDEMLEYIRIYADSVETEDEKDTRAKKAGELYQYLNNNKEGLMPYQKRNIRLPELQEGMRYGNMGGGTGEPELYGHYGADEREQEAVVNKRCQ